jgi:hypothetical protein
VLHLDGSVRDYFEYDFYRFVDMTVIDNEVYVAEAFAPRVYNVDIDTGDLDVFIDDWSLFYFYGVAFDGTYIDEWDLNRYDVNGDFMGWAACDEYVLGSTWDGTHYWTLNDTNEMKCWDISGWPTISEVPENGFAPPTPDCRGLWFDGEYFWTAESQEGLGQIFQFDDEGHIIRQWIEPAFSGWAACVSSGTSTGVSVASSSAPTLSLLGVAPQPVRSKAAIEFTLPQPLRASLRIYNVLGESVGTLIARELSAGTHEVMWDARALPAGVYFLELRAGEWSATRKILRVD